MRFRKELMVIAIAILITLTLGAGSGLCANPITQIIPCSATNPGIGGVSFTDGHGKPVTITSVRHVDASGNTPAYCEVKGYRRPMDLFIIGLPDSWIGPTYFQTGNGGAAGALGSIATGLQRGYVSASGSGGHDVSQESGLETFQYFYPPTDPTGQRKLNDYCYGSIHLTKLLALDMIKAYYGTDKAPARSYYNACSTGGRQGLIEAQRYPNDFDGLVIGAPVHYLSHITQRGVWERQALASDPWTATGGSIAPKLPLLAAAVMAKCDGIDGVVDGVIDDPRKCTFNPLTDLTPCPSDQDASTCFTTAQRNAIKKIYDGPPGLAFTSVYPSHGYGSEEMVPGASTPASNWMAWIVPIPPFLPVSLGFDLGAGWVKWVGLPPSGKGGPGWDWTTHSWTGGDPQLVVDNTSAKCDAINPNLTAVQTHGAKIIHYDGWSDPATGPFMTVKYYDAVLSNMGDANTKSFYKLYMIPGMGHCSGGLGCGAVDWQAYIEDWVERGLAPGTIIGSRAAGGTSGTSNYMTARTRPLCPYPDVARYKGTGSIDDAANFGCASVEVVSACDNIKELAFTDEAFGKPVTITSTTIVAATATLPEYCNVRGSMWPTIGFAIKLPTTTWNNRFQMTGCSGAAGSIPESTIVTYVQQGFAAAGTDTGHSGGTFDFTFGYNPPDNSNPNAEQKINDYGYRAMHEMAVLTKKMIKAYYGVDPSYSYYNGASCGGGRGMKNFLVYPGDFNGWVVGMPSFAKGGITGMLWSAKAGLLGPGAIPTSKLKLLADTVYAKCDGIDGLVDGFIDDPRKCNFSAVNDLPQCPNDVDAATCFTTAQREAIQKIYDGVRTSTGELLNPGLNPGSEIMYPSGSAIVSNWANWVVGWDGKNPTTNVNLGFAESYFKYMTRPPLGPTWDWQAPFNFDTAPQLFAAVVPRTAVDDPDLSKVKQSGGKIIHYHGWSDQLIRPLTSIMYYEDVLKTMGDAATKSFYKLYMVPGYGHGTGFGCSTAGWDAALRNWVEKGIEPEAIIGTRSASTVMGTPVRTRPLCPYPEVARYLGTGSIDDAKNFTCVEIISARVQIMPARLSLGRTKMFTAFVTGLPKGYHARDWKINAVVSEGAPAVEGSVRQGYNYFIAKFETQDFDITPGEEVTFTVSIIAEYDGKTVAFEGTDTVKVVE